MNDKIIILGFMGCGKSTIGKALAKRLDYQFIDLDDEIEKAAKTTISKLFEIKGEAYFRRLESKTLKTTLGNKGKVVIALGGGTPCYNNNMELIKNLPSFYIRCGVEVLSKRLAKEKAHRPIIASKKHSELKNFIAKKLSERRKFYSQASYLLVGARSVNEIVGRIESLLSKLSN